MTEELKNDAKIYANKKFNEEQAYLHDIIAQTYLDSAEPREKRIEELEQKLEQTEKDLADYQFNYPTIKELEKENKILAQQIKDLRKDLEENKSDCALCYSKDKEQLEWAKEIIREFMITETGGIGYSELYDKAEQFLKENE